MWSWSDFMAWFKPAAIKPVVIKLPMVEYTEPTSIPSDIPQCGQDLAKSFEKCVLVGYPDEKGVPTDGWGNTFGAQIGVAITQEKADADFVRNSAWAWEAIKKHVKVPLTANQGGALFSLVFNIGETEFAKSSLLMILNSGNYMAIPNKIKQWVWITLPDGSRKISDGLVNRRKAEAALFVGSDWRQV